MGYDTALNAGSLILHFSALIHSFMSHDVCTATDYGLDGQGSIPGEAIYYFRHISIPVLRSPSIIFNGHRGLFPRR
jgi:hypothetical protein